MISLNTGHAKIWLSALHATKEKGIIHTSKPRSVVKIILKNVFVMLVIFKNETVNI